LSFITGKFSGEVMRTNAFTVLDRGRMDYILKEQGFQLTGACNSSECQVQMGQLLGVDFIVVGNLVRFGSKYAFRADYIDVGSGKVLYFAEQEESGDLEDVYGDLCLGVAQQLAQMAKSAPLVADALSPVIPTQTGIQGPAPKVPADVLPVVPSKPLSGKRKFALALWGTALLGSGGGYYFNGKAKGYMTDYNAANTAWEIPANRTEALVTDLTESYDDATNAKTYRSISYGVSLTALVAGAVLWFLPEGK
jgi:hypothetical protein